MKNTISNLDLSYQMQCEFFGRKDEESESKSRTWLNESTVDYWRHIRKFLPLQPLLDHYPNSSWLTIGDGRLGLDSVKLKKMKPSIGVLPTDISTTLLERAKEMNIVSDYREENAEALSFDDNAFDFSFCKESYHHFPRPYIALYNMVRVAKKGIVFIEPNDRVVKKVPEIMVSSLKRLVKSSLGMQSLHSDTWNFEMSGNFIYTVSRREMEKVALALQLPAVAFYYFNDYYEKGVEFEKAVPGNELFEQVKKNISKADIMSKLGFQNWNCIIAILFKESPEAALRKNLQTAGFRITDLPENPYFKKRKSEIAEG